MSRRAVDQAVNFSQSDMNSCLSKDWPSPFLTNRVRLFLTASANLRCSLCFCRAFLASGVSPVDSPGQPGPRFSPRVTAGADVEELCRLADAPAAAAATAAVAPAAVLVAATGLGPWRLRFCRCFCRCLSLCCCCQMACWCWCCCCDPLRELPPPGRMSGGQDMAAFTRALASACVRMAHSQALWIPPHPMQRLAFIKAHCSLDKAAVAVLVAPG